MAVRKGKDKKTGIYYDVDLMVNGRRSRKRFSSAKYENPRRVAYKYYSQIESELSFKSDQIKLDIFIPLYLNYCRTDKKESTYLTDKGRIKILYNWFCKNDIVYIEHIGPQVMEKYKNWYLANAPLGKYLTCHKVNFNPKATLNRYIQLTKAMLNWAVSQKYLEISPLMNYKQMPIAKKEARYFSVAEVNDILSEAQEPYKSYYEIIFHSGLRRQELYYLRWSDIDWDNKFLRLRIHGKYTPKTNQENFVAIGDELYVKLKHMFSLKAKQAVYLFDDGFGNHSFYINTPLMHLYKIIKKLGIEHGGIHSMRHTYGFRYLEITKDRTGLQRQLGHRSPKTTDRYSHLSESFRISQANKINYEK